MKSVVTTLCLLAACLTGAMASHAEDSAKDSAKDPAPRIGLVLSGGGARGLAHIGVLRALEERNIRIDAIAGTSMGAIVGALYASGQSPDEIEAIAKQMDWRQGFDDEPARDRLTWRRKRDSRTNTVKAEATLRNGGLKLPKGVAQGQNLQMILQDLFLHVSDITDFNDLNIPFRAVASDLVTGRAVVLDRGSIATALRASMSIPGLYAPVEMDGYMLADGGIANNLPIDVMRTMDVDHIIAVDIATPLYNADQLDSVIPIVEQLTTLLTFNQIRQQYELLNDSDLLVRPDLKNVGTTDFGLIDETIARGYSAMSTEVAALSRYASDQPISNRPARQFRPPIVDRILIVNTSSASDELILAQISQVPGQPLDDAQLRADIDSIYGYRYFESVQYDIISEAGSHTLRIKAEGRSWGRDLVGLNLDVFSDVRAESDYNLGLTFRKSGVSRKGGEWYSALSIGQDPGLYTELYLPIDYQQRWFARPYVEYSEETYSRIQNNTIDSRIRIDEFRAGLLFGLEINHLAIVGLGIEHHDGDIKTFVGPPTGQVLFEDNVIYGLLEADTLDNVSFPREGHYARLRVSQVEPTDATQFNMLEFSFTSAFPVGGHSLIIDGQFLRSNSTSVSRHLLPALGGMKRLSGLHNDALVDNNLAYLGITYLHRINSRRMFDLPVYLGFALETGNVWTRSDDVDLGDTIGGALLMMGIDTPIGPVYAGYGRAETDDSAFYLKVGHMF